MARNHEANGKYGDPVLTGTTLMLSGKHPKARTVEIVAGRQSVECHHPTKSERGDFRLYARLPLAFRQRVGGAVR